MRWSFSWAIPALAFASCSSSTTENAPADGHYNSVDSQAAGYHRSRDTRSLSDIRLASDIDTSCGMPLIAGITDTMSYEGEIYGFCSPACKQQFKMPVSGESQPVQGLMVTTKPLFKSIIFYEKNRMYFNCI